MGSILVSSSNEDHTKPAPLIALEWCQRLRGLVETQHLVGPARYSPERDAEYRRLYGAFLDLLARTPSLRAFASRTDGLPVGLSSVCNDEAKWRWGFVDRQSVINLEGRILTVVEREGINAFPSPSPSDVDARSVGASAAQPPVPASKRPNRAQQRADERRERARGLRSHGRTIKEIASILGCSERTVSTYLNDASPSVG